MVGYETALELKMQRLFATLSEKDRRRYSAVEAANGRRQLAWPVDDNYLVRLDLSREGPEARVTVIS